MKKVLSSILLVAFCAIQINAQYVNPLKKGASDAFLDTFDQVSQNRQQQKEQEKRMKQQNPYWTPPKELGVPYLGLETGISHFKGEYVGLKAALMGFDIFGGISKEWVFKNHTDKETFWHAGIGYYFGDTYDGSGESSLDITVGTTPICPDVSIMGSFSLGYFFDASKRIGVKGTLGVGCGDLDRDEPKFIWEFGVGLIIKLFADDY